MNDARYSLLCSMLLKYSTRATYGSGNSGNIRKKIKKNLLMSSLMSLYFFRWMATNFRVSSHCKNYWQIKMVYLKICLLEQEKNLESISESC